MRSELEQTIGGHPCPVGGRTVFREYDSYEICPFCGWEDNAFQEAHPYTGGGPNASLHSCRRSYRKKIAVNPSYTWAKEQDELCLKKGIFWIVDRENLKNNEPYLFRIPVDPIGIPRPLAPIPPLNSKNGDSYNHKQTWKEYVPAELRGGKPYNYYPRGRVEIKDKGKTKIFLNPDITAEDDGNDKAFVILTGLGGSTDGFGNKYSQIAEYVQSDYGFPVFIAPTPEDVWEKKEKFFDETVARFIQNKTCVYLMGVSAGATIALWYAAKYPQIERVLCVNPVLNINLHMTSNGVRNFSGEKLAVVFGEKDPSAKWAKLLPALPCLKVHIIPDADHVFSGKLDEFIDLPKKYLFA